MKNTFFAAILLSTIAFASANTDSFNVTNVSKHDGKTYVTFERHYVDSVMGADYLISTFTRPFNGLISTKEEVVRKGALLVDSYITVNYDGVKKQGQAQVMSERLHQAFMNPFVGLEAYFKELNAQIADQQ